MEEKTIGKQALQDLLIIEYNIPKDVAFGLIGRCPNLSINSHIITGVTGDVIRYDEIELYLIPYTKDFAFAYDNTRDCLFIKKLRQ